MSKKTLLECDQCGLLGERDGKAQADFFVEGHELFWPGHQVTVLRVSRGVRRGGPKRPTGSQAAGSPSNGAKIFLDFGERVC
jgi:hypothetical protein